MERKMNHGFYDKKLILYGAGKYGKRYLEKIGKEKIYAFVDSNKELEGKYIEGKKVLSIKALLADKEQYLLFPSVALDKRESVIQSIIQYGLEQCITYTPYYDKVIAHKQAYHGLNTIFGGENLLGAYSYIDNAEIGYASYIAAHTKIESATIGKYTSIGPNVHIVMGQHPTHKFVSTHPAFYSINRGVYPSYVDEQLFEEYRYVKDNVSVNIGNDVWIGDSASIMEGVTIADGTIVAAGSMVVKDTEPYSIVGGVPAKVLSYRFTKEQINFLLDLMWWDKEESWIMKNAKNFTDIEKLIDSEK